ncbi:MAG TPA: acyloxyacyl hydrolase [Terriglobales bacterium]|nr:acyloxyacyl hydrolase [Terriglobales bacterium]
MSRGSLRFLATMMFAVLTAGMLSGQNYSPPTQTKGTNDTEIWAAGVVAQHDGSTTFNNEVWLGGAGFGHILTAPHGSGWLRGTLQWNIDFIPVFVVTNLQTAYGAEIDPLVWRWNFQRKGRTVPYFEMAGGVAYTNTKIPPGDTSRFNIVPKFGFGWHIFRAQQRSLDVGVFAWHLSNAWTAPRNPSANGLMFTVGYTWFGPRKVADTKHSN